MCGGVNSARGRHAALQGPEACSAVGAAPAERDGCAQPGWRRECSTAQRVAAEPWRAADTRTPRRRVRAALVRAACLPTCHGALHVRNAAPSAQGALAQPCARLAGPRALRSGRGRRDSAQPRSWLRAPSRPTHEPPLCAPRKRLSTRPPTTARAASSSSPQPARSAEQVVSLRVAPSTRRQQQRCTAGATLYDQVAAPACADLAARWTRPPRPPCAGRREAIAPLVVSLRAAQRRSRDNTSLVCQPARQRRDAGQNKKQRGLARVHANALRAPRHSWTDHERDHERGAVSHASGQALPAASASSRCSAGSLLHSRASAARGAATQAFRLWLLPPSAEACAAGYPRRSACLAAADSAP